MHTTKFILFDWSLGTCKDHHWLHIFYADWVHESITLWYNTPFFDHIQVYIVNVIQSLDTISSYSPCACPIHFISHISWLGGLHHIIKVIILREPKFDPHYGAWATPYTIDHNKFRVDVINLSLSLSRVYYLRLFLFNYISFHSYNNMTL